MAQLQATLESLRSQTYRSREIVVVVDHNRDLAAELRGSADQSSMIVTENIGANGLSSARNAGIEHSKGEIIAFIDDDAMAEPRWLERLASYYGSERVLAVGGGIIPMWEGSRPRWFPEELLWTVGCSYRGLPAGGPVRNVIGCNMSFRSGVFNEIGGFSDFVGRLGSQPTGCEETELCIRALRRWPGRQIIYAPEAVVLHHVPKERQTLRYVIRRSFSEGVSKARTRRLAGPAALSSERHYLTRTLGGALLSNTRDLLLLKDRGYPMAQNAVICAAAMSTAVGFLAGIIQGGPPMQSKDPAGRP
jgi:glycosyltransferase involved in cell wall biosynthesis